MIEHAKILIVVIGVARHGHNRIDKAVKSHLVRESLLQVGQLERDVVAVFAVHGVVPHGCFWSLHLEKGRIVHIVGMCAEPLDSALLN